MKKETNESLQQLPWQERGGLTGHWLKRAYLVMRRQLEGELRQLGLTHPQWAALGQLYYRPGMTHSQLEDALMIEAPSVTSLINGMEKKGWVKRRQHPEDARIKQIFITEAGKKVIEPALRLGEAGEEQLRQVIPAEELEQVKKTLRKIVQLYES
ncbi:MarR family transcriptional regulator [Brevibacillus humidisoli]|uniref:MarR family winged helix-turn-helix transcriptional regulator n=1 Tax=Brevibacillus humidisoli TaxID=2895522 RepID=UPI001E37359A|nr:MarR family transcriptional regulator [Brevibacillus humidisoli]UFJ40318.1 MarR family transcriptional regulator [Brevibacillus humidisoli]